MKLKWNPKVYCEREFYVGLFSVLFGIFMICAPDRNDDLYRMYPKVVFCGLILTGVAMIFFALFVKHENDILKAKIDLFELLILAVVLLGRPLIGLFGLYSAVFFVTVCISIMIQRDKTPKKLMTMLLFNLVLMAILYCVFALFLKVNAPDALLF